MLSAYHKILKSQQTMSSAHIADNAGDCDEIVASCNLEIIDADAHFQVIMNAVKRHSFLRWEVLKTKRKVQRWSLCMSLSKTNMEMVG